MTPSGKWEWDPDSREAPRGKSGSPPPEWGDDGGGRWRRPADSMERERC